MTRLAGMPLTRRVFSSRRGFESAVFIGSLHPGDIRGAGNMGRRAGGFVMPEGDDLSSDSSTRNVKRVGRVCGHQE